MRASLVFALLMLAAMSLPSVAQHMNSSEAPCRDAGGSTIIMANCFSQALEIANANLQRTYSKLKEKLPIDDFNRLQAAQRLWLKYRDANCAAEYALYGGGTGGPVARLACLEEDTRIRTKELHTIYGWKPKN